MDVLFDLLLDFRELLYGIFRNAFKTVIRKVIVFLYLGWSRAGNFNLEPFVHVIYLLDGLILLIWLKTYEQHLGVASV